MTQRDYLKKFKELTQQMYKTTEAKNQDYASAHDAFRNFRKFGPAGILVRMQDKMERLYTALWERRKFKVDESTKDTLLDLAVYAIICIAMLEEAGDTDNRSENAYRTAVRPHRANARASSRNAKNRVGSKNLTPFGRAGNTTRQLA